MKRSYEEILSYHYTHHEQMAFISGPRQSGKTTLTRHLQALWPAQISPYYNWDIATQRQVILSGYPTFIPPLLHLVSTQKPLIIFDEIHKYKLWKNYLKGCIDEYKGQIHLCVTGSAKLNIFRKNSDSLMGRYLLYRTHPLSIGEIVNPSFCETLWKPASPVSEETWNTLFTLGGYPEPFLKQSQRFYYQWQNLRHEQFFKEDLRTMAQIQDLPTMEVLALHCRHQAGQLLNYSNLASKVQVASTTIKRWIQWMNHFYYSYTLQPWHRNVARSLMKEPKLYLWDWSVIEDLGAKVENFVANHLLKAVHFWSDAGLGNFELFFVRDKEKREVDFLITQNQKPWMLIEVKHSEKEPLSKNLLYFQQILKPTYTFQLAFNMDYMDIDCSTLFEPKIVPAKTFLSQLP
jgi:hypothetical protein